MSFKFPADPKDGTVIVNGDIKGTYDENTNTWVVEKLQIAPGIPGPSGPKGDLGPVGPVGQGVQVEGAVESTAYLPSDAADNTFWVVNDTNTLYFWDGTTWTDLGGPIQGPQGPQGEAGNDGQDGSNGIDGNDGDGWYGTETITDNDEYKIKFLSNEPYLEFTTSNLKGEPGDQTVATKQKIGGIRIGRGLDIDEEGTATAGATNVRIETVPLPGSYTQTFQPIYLNVGSYKEENTNAAKSFPAWINNTIPAIPMPANSDMAAVFWFAGASLDITPSKHGYSAPNGDLGTFRAYLENWLTVSNGVFSTGSTQAYAGTNLNLTMAYYRKSDGTTNMDGRGSTSQLCKFDVITFPRGGSVGFNWRVDIVEMSRGSIASGGLRMMILPFQSAAENSREFVDRVQMMSTYDGDQDDDFRPTPPTDTQLKDMNGADLHQRVNTAITYVDSLSRTFPDEANQIVLTNYRTELVALITLPGTYTDVDNALKTILDELNTTYGQEYRFQD